MIFKANVQKLDREARRHSFYLCKIPDLKEKQPSIIKIFMQKGITHILRHAKYRNNTLDSVCCGVFFREPHINLRSQTCSLNSKNSWGSKLSQTCQSIHCNVLALHWAGKLTVKKTNTKTLLYMGRKKKKKKLFKFRAWNVEVKIVVFSALSLSTDEEKLNAKMDFNINKNTLQSPSRREGKNNNKNRKTHS